MEAQKQPPRLEKPVQITKQVWPEGTAPLVSILCLTYNHAKYIAQAMDSFLAQETTFPVEIIVHDDASNDGTSSILKEYKERFPKLIHLVGGPNRKWPDLPDLSRLSQEHCTGIFVAMCEGDDFWTDARKLETQLEILSNEPHLSCCFHQTKVVDERGSVIREENFHPPGSEFDFYDCLTKLKKGYATCSMVFRAAALQNIRSWFSASPNDMFLELQLAMAGNILFIDKNMGAYRRHSEGVWSGISMVKRTLEMLNRYKLLLEDPEIYRSYGTEIRHMMNKWEKSLCAKSECAAILSSQSIFHRIAATLDYQFRLIAGYLRNLKNSGLN